MVAVVQRAAAGWCALVVLSSCAKGAVAPSDPLGRDESALADGGGFGLPTYADAGIVGSGSGLREDQARECDMGAVEDCSCDGGKTGTRRCFFDPRSPTGGFFSECTDCGAPDAQAEPEDAGTTSAAIDASSPGDVPTGGTMPKTGGAGGAMMMTSGGTAAPPPPRPQPTPPPKTCPGLCTGPCSALGPFPCCNTSTGICGCTWAPGAYCL